MSIKEKELEDLICKHPHCILSPEAIILGRQIPLRHGRADILAWDYGQTYIIELKVVPLQEKDVGQVLRYTNDVTMHLFYAFQRARGKDENFDLSTWRGNEYADALMPYANATPSDFPAIQSMLIGPSISSYTLAAADGAGVHVQTYSINEKKQVSLKGRSDQEAWKAARDHTPAWASQIVSMAEILAKEESNDAIDSAIESLFNL